MPGGTSVSLEIPNVKRVGKAAKICEHCEEFSHSVQPAKRVLLLESDMWVGKGTKMFLESAGYDVVSVSGLSEAYDVQRALKVDSACLELAVGEDATMKLIEALRSGKSDMPIVVKA